jgi:hypothetical protein
VRSGDSAFVGRPFRLRCLSVPDITATHNGTSLTPLRIPALSPGMSSDDLTSDDDGFDVDDATDAFDVVDESFDVVGDDDAPSTDDEVSSGTMADIELLGASKGTVVDRADTADSVTEIALRQAIDSAAGPDEQDIDDTPAEPSTHVDDDDDDDDGELTAVRMRAASEFLCSSCFLIASAHRRAEPGTDLCQDCG